MHKISIIVTVWNLEDCIAEALESLQNQTVKPYEVIIIDDGSEDLSKNLITSYLARNTSWHFYPLLHRGVAHSRNFGLSKVQGDYVLFLDGDDIYQPDLVENLHCVLSRKPEVVVFRCLELDNHSGLTFKSRWTIRTNRSPENFKNSILYCFVGWPWDKLFKVSFLRKNNLLYPDLLNSEDLVFVFSALLLSENILTIDNYLIKHRVNRTSSLSNNLCNSENSFYTAILLLEDFIKRDPILWQENRQCFQEWSIDLTFWATKSRGLNFDALKQIYPRINWRLQPNKPSFFPNLKFLLKSANKTNCDGILWFLSYNLYKVRKFGLRRTFFIILTYLVRKVKQM